jgi:hypothetical protein
MTPGRAHILPVLVLPRTGLIRRRDPGDLGNERGAVSPPGPASSLADVAEQVLDHELDLNPPRTRMTLGMSARVRLGRLEDDVLQLDQRGDAVPGR